MLVLSNLRLIREGFSLEVEKLRVRPGTVCAIVGESGSGKSTLLSAIAGFEVSAQGQIEIQERRIEHLAPEQRKIALMFQKAALFPHLNVYENVEFGLKVQGLAQPQRELRVKEWLKKLNLQDLEKKNVQTLSGGEAQRVALARALIVGFPVILLDEPFSALDIGLRRKARDLVKGLVKELSIATVLVTHDLEDVLELADEAAVMVKGKIVRTGTPNEICEYIRAKHSDVY